MFRIRVDKGFSFPEQGVAAKGRLSAEQISELRAAAWKVLGHEFDELTVALTAEDCVNILYVSGRSHHTLSEERVRALLEENCEAEQSGRFSFGELTKLAHLMDHPLIKIGWNPVKRELTPGSAGVPA